MSKPSVALVAHEIHFKGGQERNFAELAARLVDRFDVHLVCADAADVPFDRLKFHKVTVPIRPEVITFPGFYVKASRLLQQNRFDIVHTIGGIVRAQNVITAQFCHAAWLEHARSVGRIRGYTAYHYLLSRWALSLERRAIRSSSTQAILANSAKTRADLIRHYGAPDKKTHIIHNGVDTSQFSPATPTARSETRQELGYGPDDYVVLFVGEWRRKNLTTVIRAMEHLPERVKLLAVGRGDRAHYEGLATDAGVLPRLKLHPPSGGIERFFAAVDAFAFPTLYEPFGMVITEAMASQVPVVTTRSAGAADLIEDGKSGLLLDDPYDHRALSAALLRLVEAPQEADAIALAGREAVQSLTWDEIARETIQAYDLVLGLGKDCRQ